MGRTHCYATPIGEPTLRVAFTPDEELQRDIKEANSLAKRLVKLQNSKLQKIDKAVNEKKLLPTSFLTETYDPGFLLSITGEVALMSDTDTTLIFSEENTEKLLNKAELISIITHLRARNTGLVRAGITQKGEVLALNSVEAVNDYEITI